MLHCTLYIPHYVSVARCGGGGGGAWFQLTSAEKMRTTRLYRCEERKDRETYGNIFTFNHQQEFFLFNVP